MPLLWEVRKRQVWDATNSANFPVYCYPAMRNENQSSNETVPRQMPDKDRFPQDGY